MADEPTDAPATGSDDTPTTPPAADTPKDAPLGEPGQKALAAMKDELKAARTEAAKAKALQKQLDDIQASTATEGEKALAVARKEATDEANAKANARIVRAEVKALAAGKIADPSDAVKLLDLTEFTVADDGEVDAKAISAAIDGLVKDKPYLAPSTGPGSADGGARNRDDKPTRSTSLEGAVEKKFQTTGT